MPTRSGRNRLDRYALRGGILVDTVRGAVRVRAWPKKRGKPKHPHTLYMNAWFKDMCEKIKYVDARAVDWAYQVTRGTGLYPRDILTAASTRGLFQIPDGDGNLLKPRPLGLYAVAFQGFRLQLSADQAVVSSAFHSPSWPAPIIDTAGMFSPAAPTIITIPNGVNIMRFTAAARTTVVTANRARCVIQPVGGPNWVDSGGGLGTRQNVQADTGPIDVTAGQQIECLFSMPGLGSWLSGTTWFTGEILDAELPPV